MDDVTYTVAKVDGVDSTLLLDLRTGGQQWAVIRTSPLSVKVWSFHTSESGAKAAARRWRSRDIVTR